MGNDDSLPVKGKKRLKSKLKELRNTPLTKALEVANVKSTKAEVNQRVNEVSNLLLVGYTRSYILRYAEKWKVSDSMVDQYISKAWQNIKEINELTLQDNLSMITNQLWDLYRQNRLENNLQEAHKNLVALAKIKGLEVHTINHVIEDQREFEKLTNEELDQLIEDNREELQ